MSDRMDSEKLKEALLNLIDDRIDESSLIEDDASFVEMKKYGNARNIIHCAVNGEDRYFRLELSELKEEAT